MGLQLLGTGQTMHLRHRAISALGQALTRSFWTKTGIGNRACTTSWEAAPDTAGSSSAWAAREGEGEGKVGRGVAASSQVASPTHTQSTHKVAS